MLSATDHARLDLLHPPLRTIVLDLMRRAHGMLEEAEPRRWRIRLGETWRAPARQMDLYRKGRSQVAPGVWQVIAGQHPVTNALPADSPHCVRTADGTPAALAADLLVVDAVSGLPAGDREIVWSVIPCAAWLAGPRVTVSGAFWTAPRDWPHVEWRGWRALVREGVLTQKVDA